MSGLTKSLLLAGGVLAASLLLPFGWVLLWIGFDPDPDEGNGRQGRKERIFRWLNQFTAPFRARSQDGPDPRPDMNSQFNRLAIAEVGSDSDIPAADTAGTWGVKEVVVVAIAIVLLVAGACIAAVPTYLPYEEIMGGALEDPFAAFTQTAIDFFTAVATVLLVALSVICAMLAWVALRVGNLPRGLIVPIAALAYLIVAAAPFAANSEFTNAAATVVVPSLAVYGLCAYLIVIVARQYGGTIANGYNALNLKLPTKLSHYAIAIGIYAAAYVAVTIWALGIEILEAPDWIQVPDNATDILEQAGLPLTIITAAVLAPIGEEVVFRGFALPGLASRLGVTSAILITSAVFALIHLGPGVGIGILPVTFILGLAFAFVYHKTQSLILAIAVHALHNAITIVALAVSDTVA